MAQFRGPSGPLEALRERREDEKACVGPAFGYNIAESDEKVKGSRSSPGG